MATFKKFDEQQTYQVPVYITGGAELEVGDVFSHNPATHEGAEIKSKAEAIAALADQKELYLVAQSDAVTYKTGTEYKNYAIGKTVNVGANAENETIVVAYRITFIDNVEGLE